MAFLLVTLAVTQFFASPWTRSATSQTFTAEADTYASEFTPDERHGTSDVLKVDGGRLERSSYIRFDLRGARRDVKTATLRVYSTRDDDWGVAVRLVRDNSWDEKKLTFHNAPRAGPLVGHAGPIDEGEWVEIDVTSVLRHGTLGGDEVSLALTPSLFAFVGAVDHDHSREATARFASREAGRAPQLKISSEGAPQVSTTTMSPPTTAPPTTTPPTTAPPPTTTPPPPTPGRKMYAYYYLWWSTSHWQDKLGPNYPYGAQPLPLPATLDPNGCDPKSLYVGNELFDVPASLYSQDDAGVIERHVRQAAATGLAGFIVNWKGTGHQGQVTSDSSYSRRLAELVRATEEVNGEGTSFKLILNYAGSQNPTLDQMLNDWAYLEREHADSPVLERSGSSRPLLIWNSTPAYPIDVLRSVANRYRGSFFIMGTESWKTWTRERASLLDGDTYYWSSQNPYTNPQSFDQLQSLAFQVRSSGPNPDGSAKLWFAPLAPGYNHILGGGSSCVPRNDGATLQALFAGNSLSRPDAWALISWNEIAEGSYVEPLSRWGDAYLTVVADLLRGN